MGPKTNSNPNLKPIPFYPTDPNPNSADPSNSTANSTHSVN